MNEHVATIETTDGRWVPVFLQPDGRQFVVDNDGRRRFGIWWWPEEDEDGSDQPTIIDDCEL
jgi:hypothetical protein